MKLSSLICCFAGFRLVLLANRLVIFALVASLAGGCSAASGADAFAAAVSAGFGGSTGALADRAATLG
jgi:hypothetical protein